MRIALLGMFGEWCLGTDVLNFVMVEHPVAYPSNQVSFSWVGRYGPQQSICFLGTVFYSRRVYFLMVEQYVGSMQGVW